MNYKQSIRCGFVALSICCVCLLAGSAVRVVAQEASHPKAGSGEKSGRDPFKRYQPIFKPTKGAASMLTTPSIEQRIERYRALKMAAANAHMPAPKPTTALLLSELQVIGIFRTPRGWAAMVEATPIKLSYVVYPGETFFDGQLVAIEETGLVFRREAVWSDGRREKSVEVKPLRKFNLAEAMTAAKGATAPANSPAAAPEKTPVPEKQ